MDRSPRIRVLAIEPIQRGTIDELAPATASPRVGARRPARMEEVSPRLTIAGQATDSAEDRQDSAGLSEPGAVTRRAGNHQQSA